MDEIAAHDDAVSDLCLRNDFLVSTSWDATVKVYLSSHLSSHLIPHSSTF